MAFMPFMFILNELTTTRTKDAPLFLLCPPEFPMRMTSPQYQLPPLKRIQGGAYRPFDG